MGMPELTAIVAIRVSTQRDLLRIVREVRKGNVIVASLSAFRSLKIRRDIVRRILEAGKRLRFNILGVGSEFMIIAPERIKIEVGDSDPEPRS